MSDLVPRGRARVQSVVPYFVQLPKLKGSEMRIRKLSVTLVGGLLAVGSAFVTTVPAHAATGPCGSLTYDAANPPSYDRVIVLMDENISYSTFLSPKLVGSMPYLHGLTAQCGSESYMHAATHPSKNNYVAATSGLITSYSTANNIFNQMQAKGMTWANYAESESTACQQKQVDPYKNGHVPAAQYADLRSPINTCLRNQIPMDATFDQAVNMDTLPNYTWISPNECHGTYWVTACGGLATDRFAVGDTWASSLIPRLTAMPSYSAGKTLIIITWDEGDKTQPHSIDCTDPAVYSVKTDYCAIPTIVVSPYISPGTVDPSDQSLFTLLGTTEDILGVDRLNSALTHPSSMRPGLGF